MKGVNLLPSDLPRPQKTSVLRVTAAAAVCTFLFAASLLYTMKVEEVKELRHTLEIEEKDFARYAWLDGAIEGTRKTQEKMLARLAEARKQTESGLPARDILSELPQLMPERVWLVQFVLADNEKARVEGEAASLQDVAAFLLSLEDSDLFEDVSLLRAMKSDEADFISFQAEAVLCRTGGSQP
ncbi:MAG: PilN domain-containing protein [Bacillota bacterium]